MNTKNKDNIIYPPFTLRKMGLNFLSQIALVTLVMFSISSSANAATLTFSAAQLDAFTVQSFSHPYTINDLGLDLSANAVVLSPTYSDGTPGMSGVAGAAGLWSTAAFGSSVNVYLGSSMLGDLSGFGYTNLAIEAFNNNDDTWGHDVWIETVANGRVESSITNIATGGSSILNLDISTLDLSNVTGYGVSIHGTLNGISGNPSPGDSFHSSWTAIPEPSTYLLLGSMLAVASFAKARKRKVVKS